MPDGGVIWSDAFVLDSSVLLLRKAVQREIMDPVDLELISGRLDMLSGRKNLYWIRQDSKWGDNNQYHYAYLYLQIVG